ncbi:MAG: phosphotransferase family protein [Myxococcota bacterium]
MTFDPEAHGAAWRPAFEAVESLVGGRILSVERQARWRPVFWIEVERPDGERRSVCFRSARLEQGEDHTARHEYACQRALEEQGIPVPHVYGYCEAPAGYVMDRVPGRPDLATAESPEERDAVRDEFIEILARIHALPLEPFRAIGLAPKRTPLELALGDTAAGIARYRRLRKRPDPVVDFLIDWCERNAPPGRSENVFLTGDSGQFLFEKGRVTALLDVELAYLGDPLADLGGLFSRDLSEKMGDLGVAIDRYEAASGRAVDRRVVLYHAIRFALTTPVGTTLALATPHVAVDHVQYLTWYLVYARNPLELIAYREGIPLEEPERVETVTSPWRVGHDLLEAKLDAFETPDAFGAYEKDAMRRLARHLAEADRIGPRLLEQDLDDVASLLGRRPADWRERDEQLSSLVAANAGEHDAGLVRYLVRRIRREEAILAPAQRDLVDARMQRIPLSG